jgi:hypothetical protein
MDRQLRLDPLARLAPRGRHSQAAAPVPGAAVGPRPLQDREVPLAGVSSNLQADDAPPG